ncbi:MAG: hypothetical protein WCT85_03350 [Parachlamydiales bacterium]|jgi:hypothetical protein
MTICNFRPIEPANSRSPSQSPTASIISQLENPWGLPSELENILKNNIVRTGTDSGLGGLDSEGKESRIGTGSDLDRSDSIKKIANEILRARTGSDLGGLDSIEKAFAVV